MDNNIIIYYTRYVDDMLVVFDTRRTTENTILEYMNSINKHLEFKMTVEDNNKIDYLDLTIIRRTNHIRQEQHS
jgi:hypothetical protein